MNAIVDEAVLMQRVGGAGWGEPLKPVSVEQVLDVLAGREDEDANGHDQGYWISQLIMHSEYGSLPVIVATEIVQHIAAHRCVTFQHGRGHLITAVKTALEER